MLNNVIDLSHHNRILDLDAVKRDGIAAIIHKASQGVTMVDPKYKDREKRCRDKEIMWGAYHFGTGNTDAIDQAEHFLEVAGNTKLLVLDLEPNPHGQSMSLTQAENFISTIYKHTSRWPGVYVGYYHIQDLMAKSNRKSSPILANCWLWIPQYRKTLMLPTPKIWATWTMWQYTDGADGEAPHSVNGIGHCDRNKFNGNLDRLETLFGE